MDLGELNRQLSALTPSEQRYREGQAFDWAAEPGREAVTIEGREMFRMGESLFKLARTNLSASGPDAQTGRPLPLAGQFALVRNSRFNPVPEHVHDYMEMSYVYAGTCRQTVNGREITLRENQALLLDSNCPHSIAAQSAGDIMISVAISRAFLNENLVGSVAGGSMVSQFLVGALSEQTDHNRYVLFQSHGSRRLKLYFQELMCEYLDPSINADEIVLRLFQLILCELVNVYEADYDTRELAAKRVPVTPIIYYIEQNYLTCTQESVAEHFYISPNYVSQLLKKHTGMTYIQMVQAQKLAHAATLLRHSDLPVTEVARQSGYENMSFFYKKFEAAYGCKPSQYRAQAQQPKAS